MASAPPPLRENGLAIVVPATVPNTVKANGIALVAPSSKPISLQQSGLAITVVSYSAPIVPVRVPIKLAKYIFQGTPFYIDHKGRNSIDD